MARPMHALTVLVGRIGGIVASLGLAGDRPDRRTICVPTLLSPRGRGGCLPGTAAENDGIDVADHATLHDLALIDRDMADAGNVLDVHVLERSMQSLGRRDRLAIAIADVIVDIAAHATGQAGLE